MPSKVVAIVGSSNVGKSTIFNRIIGDRRAIVDDEAGITRDRLYGKASWLGKSFTLIDTGGIELENRPFQEQIRAQANIAIEEADVILFVVDGQVGITNDDIMVARILRKVKKPILLLVNKIDEGLQAANAAEFYTLGLGEPIPVSGSHGVGIGDVLNKIVNYISDEKDELKKKGKIYEAVDKYSAIRALKAIERSEIVLLVLDGSVGVTDQDKHVIQYATDLHKAIIIVVNKWDLVDKETNTMSEFEKTIRKEYKFLDYAPIIFLSALTKRRVNTLFEKLREVHEAYYTRIKTSLLNDVLQEAQVMNQAPDFNGGRLKIYYATQVLTAPPTITISVNDPEFMHFSYQRYIENRLRETFNFDGTPIRIQLKKHRN